MGRKLGMLAMVAALLLWTAGLALAQTQNQSVQITNGPVVENTTGNSVTVAWSTNVNAGSVVRYGTDPNKLDQRAQVPWGGMTHRVTIKNLQPNTTYYFQVESSQGQGTGTGALSDIQTFKTSGEQSGASAGGATASNAGPGNFQLVAGPIVQDLTDKSATLWWQTNQAVEGSKVHYGTSPNALNQTAQATSENNGTTHKAQLSGLQPNTTYYLVALRPDGNKSTEMQFHTRPENFAQSGVHITNGPVLESLGDNQAVIAWSTNAPASTVVKYGTDPQSLTETAQAPWGGTTHRVTIPNLKPNTRYYFQVESAQAKGTGAMAQSQPGAFQTRQPGEAALNFTK
ncbi:MAG: fibronectin type III domain-containing protein [Terriglobales bacterium]